VLDDGTGGMGRWWGGTVPAIPAPLASRPFAAGPGEKTAQTTAVQYRRRRPYPIAKARASACRMYMPHVYWRGMPVIARSPVSFRGRTLNKYML